MSQFQVLSEKELSFYTPSVFNNEARHTTSDKYTHISTIEVIRGLMNEGFMPVKAIQTNSRSRENRVFAKHMLRFRHVDAVANDKGLYQELVLVNSHDGLSSYRLMAGIFRIVCANGLIAGNTYDEVRIRHQGDVIGNVIEGTYSVMDSAKKLLASSENMSSIILSSDEKRVFSESVHELRFDGQSVDESGIKPGQFLTPRRIADQKDDLFTVFNTAQENVIRGGLRGYALDDKGRYLRRSDNARVKRVSTREVKSIDESNKLNRALWSLAEKMAELKQ